MLATDLNKKEGRDADPTAIQQINFTVNLDKARNTTMFFIIEKTKDTRNYKSIVNLL